MKVYVIEKGCYSDRHVVGVVETEQEAKEICKNILSDDDSASYEEYDTKKFETELPRFCVYFCFGEWVAEYDDIGIYESYKESTEDYENHFVIFAKTKEVALKIAQDMRALRLAKENMIV